MSVTCEFTENTYESYQNKFYRCLVQNQTIKDDAKIEFTGNHLAGKANNDVTYIHFHNCVMSKLPKNLSKVFSNLHVISIHTTKLKSISKNDLSGLEKLQIFCMNDSEVEMIPGDLFGDYKCLEWIRFFNNPKLRIIEPNLLDKYENLKYVDLRQNIGFNVQYLDWTVPKTRHEEVRNYLAEQFFALDHQIIRDFLQKQDDPLEEIKKYTHRVKAIEKKVKMLEIRADVFEDTMNKGLIGDLKRFIQNENIKDFKINIGTKEFLVHKLLLAARCPTLAQEFSKNPDAVTLNITDISEEMFGQILKFLYTDKFPCEPGTNFIQLFGAAGRLKIVELKDLAVRKIKENVNIIDAVELLRLANKYNHDDLIETAFKQIKEEHPSIPFKDHWSHKPDKIKMVIDTFSN